MILLKRILFPTDFSEFATEAEHYACALARQHKAELHILCVTEEPLMYAPVYGAPATMMGLWNPEETRNAADTALAKRPDPEWGHDLNVRRVVRSGNPFVEIVRYAREANVDLIVIGTHGRTGLKHVLLGSCAEQVVRQASCPVLTVRPRTHSFVLP